MSLFMNVYKIMFGKPQEKSYTTVSRMKFVTFDCEIILANRLEKIFNS